MVSTGKSKAGTSGGISVSTGQALDGASGDIKMQIGDGRNFDGGDVLINAGRTSASARVGGRVVLTGGEGSSSHSADGGNGGNVEMYGGEAKGEMHTKIAMSSSFRSRKFLTTLQPVLFFLPQARMSTTTEVRIFDHARWRTNFILTMS